MVQFVVVFQIFKKDKSKIDCKGFLSLFKWAKNTPNKHWYDKWLANEKVHDFLSFTNDKVGCEGIPIHINVM
jgi:hypothetical protein